MEFPEGAEMKPPKLEASTQSVILSKGASAMKKTIVLSCMILFFTPIVSAQEKCEAPVWNVGDKWTYGDVSGRTWTNEVIDSRKDLYTVKFGGIQDTSLGLYENLYPGLVPQNLYLFDKKTLNIKYVIETGGRYKYTNMFREFFNFPIFVGKKWTEVTNGITGGIEYTLFNTFKIEGMEEVTTVAGTFNAYRINLKFNFGVAGRLYESLNMAWGETGFIGWYRFWYSPRVKTWVKRQSQTGQWWSDTIRYWYEDAELTYYKLN